MLDDATMRRMTGYQHIDDTCESSRKLTYRDFVRFPDDGRRHELIDGVHYVTATPNLPHEIVLQHLNLALGNYFKEHRTGTVLRNTDCVFSFFDIVEPDLVVVLKDRRGILTDRNIKGAPSILVEVLSPSTSKRDRTLKRDLYERHAVAEYWIVDAVRKSVAIHRSAERKYKKPEVLRLDDDRPLTSELLPAFELPLGDLFGEDVIFSRG